MSRPARALGLLLGYAADVALGDPRRGHPVALFGRSAQAVERELYGDSRSRGLAYTVLMVGTATGLGAAVQRAVRHSPLLEGTAVAVATWTVLGGRSLVREADVMTGLLAGPDLPAARSRLSHLCSRDARALSEAELVRASVESVAENTSDAVVAPLFWGVLAGVPGLFGYRAVNTLDAMVGYRDERYQRFGWASARLDDAANWVPARVAAALTTLAAPAVGGGVAHARTVWVRDGSAHPSPNAGRVEAAFAGALGVRIGGTSTYANGSQDRGVLDGGRPVELGDLARAARLSRTVGACAAGLATAAALAGAAATKAVRRG